MNFKRLSALTLLAAVLASFVSCGTSDAKAESASSDASQTDVSDSENTSAAAGSTSDAASEETLPEPKTTGSDYDGQTFLIMVNNENTLYMCADSLNGDVINDILFERDKQIEEKFSISVEYYTGFDMKEQCSLMRQSVMAGDVIADLSINHCNWETTSYINEKLIKNWHNIPNIDMEQPYWNQHQQETIEINGVLPFASNSIITPAVSMIAYNADFAGDLGFTGLYDSVEDGSWVWDSLIMMGKAAVMDINGDGEIKGADDKFGLLSGDSAVRTVPFSCGQSVYEVDSDGNIALAGFSEVTHDMMVKLCDMMYNSKAYFINEGDFASGNILFVTKTSNSLEAFREYDFTYGFLPIPKYSEEQENYYGLDWGSLCCVPITARDPAFTGEITEWMAYLMYVDFRPAYCDKLLDGKIALDERTRDMLDIILASSVYDITITYKSPAFYQFFSNAIINNDTNLASYIESVSLSEETFIDDLNESFSALKDQ